MRAIYIVHVATGIILIGLLVAFYDLRHEQQQAPSSGQSGVIGSAPAPRALPGSMVARRDEQPPLEFVNHHGEAMTDRDLRGRFALVFFGYTHCPDVCPGNLATITRVLDVLGEEAERVQPVFVSFDPARDTPERMAEYVGHFHPSMLGHTGSEEQIAAATRAYGVYYDLDGEQEGAANAPAREIHHSSNTYLIGPDGNAQAIFRHGTKPEEIAAELRIHLSREASNRADALR